VRIFLFEFSFFWRIVFGQREFTTQYPFLKIFFPKWKKISTKKKKKKEKPSEKGKGGVERKKIHIFIRA
jgi:hypothetical protein